LAKGAVEIVHAVEIAEKVDERKKDHAEKEKLRGPDALRSFPVEQGQAKAKKNKRRGSGRRQATRIGYAGGVKNVTEEQVFEMKIPAGGKFDDGGHADEGDHERDALGQMAARSEWRGVYKKSERNAGKEEAGGGERLHGHQVRGEAGQPGNSGGPAEQN
jgi:hypothetical protein